MRPSPLPAALALIIAIPVMADEQLFPEGVAAGDVRQRSATLWARIDTASEGVIAEVSAVPDFARCDLRFVVRERSQADGTVSVFAHPLNGATLYYYRFRANDRVSPVGTFRTLPGGDEQRRVRIAWLGAPAGARSGPCYAGFETDPALTSEQADVLVYFTNTTRAKRPAAPRVRERSLASRQPTSTPTIAVWRGRETRGADQLEDLTHYQSDRKAFLDAFPIGPAWPLPKGDCQEAPIVRTFSFARDLEAIVLDERSCRSPSVELACLGDPAPTAPAPLRVTLGLSAEPPSGCLDALTDPARTMLGDEQKTFLKHWLAAPGARFKLVVGEHAVDQYLAQSYERWEGYPAERGEIMEFIRDHAAGQVVFLTSGGQASAVNPVAVDVLADPAPVAYELVTRLAAPSPQREAAEEGGPAVPTVGDEVGFADANCRNLGAGSYGIVDYDPVAHALDIRLLDAEGRSLTDQAVASPVRQLRLR